MPLGTRAEARLPVPNFRDLNSSFPAALAGSRGCRDVIESRPFPSSPTDFDRISIVFTFSARVAQATRGRAQCAGYDTPRRNTRDVTSAVSRHAKDIERASLVYGCEFKALKLSLSLSYLQNDQLA